MATRKTTVPKRRKPRHAYRLLIKLAESEPAIWRLVSVPGNFTIADLDRVIQAAMGWTNSHLHLFTIGESQYGDPDEDWIDDLPVLPGGEFTLDEVLTPAVKHFTYEYDFGDCWQHEVSVQERVVADEERNGWPMCLAGANACPPEDVGGISGYGEFLQAMSDPSHEEHDAMWRWWGGPFDPRGFDINAANRDIRMWLTKSP